MSPDDRTAEAAPGSGAQPGAGPAFRPFASASRRLAQGGASVLVAGLGHLLRQNEWARAKLAMFAGRRIHVGIDAPTFGSFGPPTLAARITDEGLLEVLRPGADEPIDVQMLIRPSVAAAFALGRDGARGLSRHLRLEGEVMLAAALGEIVEQLRWDAEEDLSRITGDVVARRVGRAVESARGAMRDVRTRVETATGRHLAGDAGQLVGRGELSSLRAAIDELDRRLAGLEVPLQQPADAAGGATRVAAGGVADNAARDAAATMPQLQPPLELPKFEIDPDGENRSPPTGERG